jgi:DHA3 family macrolide efflux protein-like MFS transporter
MFLRSLAGSFHWPAFSASSALMVPAEHQSRVQGINQTLQGATNIVAAPLGAILLGLMPIASVLLIDLGTAALAIATLLPVFIPQPAPAATGDAGGGGRASIWAEMRLGLRYVAGWPGLLIVLLMALVINLLLTPAFSLLPLLVTGHSNAGALELGWMESAWGIGVVVGGLLLGIWGGFRRRVLTSLGGLIVMGAGVTALGLIPTSAFPVGVGALFIIGVTNPFINGPIQAVLLVAVAPEMQGRVLGLVMSASTAATPLGLLIAGPLADAIGVRAWYVAAGIVTAAMGAAAFFVPAVTHIEDRTKAAAVEAGPAAADAPAAAPPLKSVSAP